MAATVRVGELVAGKYRLESEIGAGGMGVIYAATHVHLEQRVALKFLLPSAAKNPEMVERFQREARAAVRVQSEHVARVIDIGELEGTPYIVMEYLEGDDLENIVDNDGPLAISDAVRYVLHTCEALAEVHVQGIVHRDIKPANLFLANRADGTSIVKLLDFGISKASQQWVEEGHGRSLTQTSAVIGSPRYMSPEQLRSSRDVDARSDVWALGVTMFELLGGDSPFAKGTMPEVCASILKDEPISLAELRKDIPSALEAVIRKCLAKEPEKRWANVAELAMALKPFAPAGSEISIERAAGVLANPRPSPSRPPTNVSRNATPSSGQRTSASRRPPAAKTGPIETPVLMFIDDPTTLDPSLDMPDVATEIVTEDDYFKRIGGDRSLVPELAIDATKLTGLSLDHRAGFLMSLVDGRSTIDDILSLSGMSRLETLDIICDLVDQRVLNFRR